MTAPALPRWLRALVAAVVVAGSLALFEYLNFHEYCYDEARFLGDRALLDAAVQYQLDFMRQHDSERGTRTYASVREFREANPICCSLDKWGDGRWSIWRRRLLGQEMMIVDLWYRFKDEGPAPFWQAHMLIDACGHIGSKDSGSDTATPPRQIWGGRRYE